MKIRHLIVAIKSALTLALLLLVPEAALAIDPYQPGDQYEQYVIPYLSPPCNYPNCVSLQFTIHHEIPHCVRYEDVWLRDSNGHDISFKIEETGRPGEPGYRFDLRTTELVAGPVTLHIFVETDCPKIGWIFSRRRTAQ